VNSKTVSRPAIGVGVLVWRDKELLLGKRLLSDKNANQYFCWQFPGGHLEKNESVIECAQREVREETGLEIQAMRHLGFTNQTFTMAGCQYITLLVSSEYKSGEVQALEPDKCIEWQWFGYQQLPEPLFEPIHLFLAQFEFTNASSGDLLAVHEASSLVTDIPSGEHK
jgi:8-oxo-dGTP diphosphatase